MWSISVLVPFVFVYHLAIGGVHDASRTTDCEVCPTVSDRPPDDRAASTLVSAGGTWYANTRWLAGGVVVGQAAQWPVQGAVGASQEASKSECRGEH